MEEKKIVFVCTGNTCRSPMAEAILRSELKRLDIRGAEVLSAGTQASETSFINPKSSEVLSENGLSLDNFNSRRLDAELLKSAYAIVCMTDALRDWLMELRWSVLRKEGFSEIENNVYSFSEIAGYEIPDPYGKDIDCYRRTFALLSEGMPRVVEKLFAVEKKEKREKAKPAAGADAASPPAEKKRKPRAKPRRRRASGNAVAAKGGKAEKEETRPPERRNRPGKAPRQRKKRRKEKGNENSRCLRPWRAESEKSTHRVSGEKRIRIRRFRDEQRGFVRLSRLRASRGGERGAGRMRPRHRHLFDGHRRVHRRQQGAGGALRALPRHLLRKIYPVPQRRQYARPSAKSAWAWA